jgi:hypothetical protein
VELIAPQRFGDRFAHELTQIDAVGAQSQVAPLQVADGQQVGGQELDVLRVVFDRRLIGERVRVARQEARSQRCRSRAQRGDRSRELALEHAEEGLPFGIAREVPRALLVETAHENRRGRVDDEPQGRVEEDSRLDLWPKKVIGQKLGEQGGDSGDERSGSADPPCGAHDDGQIEDLEIDLRRCNEICRADRCDGQQRNKTPKPTPTHGRGFSHVHALRDDQLGVGQARGPEQQREHSIVAVPVLGNDGLSRCPDDVAQDQSADHGVVQGTDDRDELRDEIDRRCDPGQADRDQHLGAERDALVAQETVKEPREIRQQQGELAHCGPSAGKPEKQQR